MPMWHLIDMKKKVTLLLILCLLIVSIASANENVCDVFVNQKLEAMGIAGSPWEESISYEEERSRAFMDALNHAYEKISNLPLMDGKEVNHIIQSNRAFKERLGQLLMTSPRTFYQADMIGINRCRIEIDLSGKNSLRSTLYLASLRPRSILPKSLVPPRTSVIEIDKDLAPSKYKRIVIDARKSYFEPSLFPTFFDRSGTLIFQEAMIPQAERFSRPAVRFVTNMIEARKDLKEQQIFTAESLIDEMHPRDIIINPTDVSEFAIFCNDITKTPLKEREIVVVFEPNKTKEYGRLKQSEEKKE